jgi:hypothetical protein
VLLFHTVIKWLLSIIVVLPVGGEIRLTSPGRGQVREIFVGDERVVKVLAGAFEFYAVGKGTGLCPMNVTGSDGARKLILFHVVKR